MSATGFYRLLLEVNVRMWRRRFAALREKSWLMVAVIVLFVLSYWVAGYVVFQLMFNSLMRFPGVGALLLDRMLYLFFAFLFVMLVFSNMIIGYSTLFKNDETQWMLTLPVRQLDVFRWKFVETTVLASWAFLFLSAPMMLAYRNVRDVSGWFFLKMFLLFLPFIIIPAALGALVILLVTRYLHRQVFKWILFGAGVGAVAVAVFFMKPVQEAQLENAHVIGALNQLLHNSRITLQPILPSYWVASSMILWGEGWVWKGTFYFLVLLSNALMLLLVCLAASARLFYDGWSRNHSQGGFQLGVALLDRRIELPRMELLDRVVGLWPRLAGSTRALIVKDIRTFWRDTSQWSQFVIFFGLLGLYVLNLRNVTYDYTNPFWAGFVSFLNLGAASMTLATLTTRFVFPQFSLEGKRLWIVGMVPDGLKHVLLEKFWLSSLVSIAITMTLMLTSCVLLHVAPWMTLLFAATVILMSFSLCSLAVGIGTLFPNFGAGTTANRQEDNPAKIVSGFGGTFCFVLSGAYVATVVGVEALPFYLQQTGSGGVTGENEGLAMVLAWVIVSLVSLVTITVPMSLALRRIEKLEM